MNFFGEDSYSNSPHVNDLAELMWKMFDPAGYNTMMMDGLKRQNPQRFDRFRQPVDDTHPRSLEDLMGMNPQYRDFMIQNYRNDVANTKQPNPMSGGDLNELLMRVLRGTAESNYQNKYKPGM